MQLYVANGSTNCRKVQAVLGRLGAEIETIFLDYRKGDLRSAAFLRMNPTGKVPVLEDDGFFLWESNAINRYVCDLHPGNTLYPAERKTRADIERWLSWELAHFNDQLGILSFQTVLKPTVFGEEPDDRLVAWSMEMLKGHAAVLDRHLDGRDHMVGDGLTIADYAVAHLEQVKDLTPFDWSPYANVDAFFARMRADPHWAATAAAPDEFVRVPAGRRAFAA